MKKVIHFVFVIASILCLILPPVFLNRQKEFVSEIDNRMLVEMPELFCEDFPRKMEEYIQDRIGFRDEMVNAYDRLHAAAFNQLSHPLYDYGRDGYVFSSMNGNQRFGDYHEQFARGMLRLQQYCQQRGVKFYLMFDPQKESIYTQYLPVGVHRDSVWVKQLMERFDELGVNYIDFTPLLKEKSRTEQVYNVQYDAGHWNDLGHFYAAEALVDRLRRDFPDLAPLEKSQFDISTEVQTTLKQSEFAIHEETPVFTLKSEVKDITASYSGELEINPQFRSFAYQQNQLPEADKYPKLLVFQGSYWNRGRQFLASRASSYISVHNYQNIFNIEYYLNLFQPDAVVFDVAEYVLQDYYFSYDALQDKLYSPAIIDKDQPAAPQVEALLQSGAKLEREQYLDRIAGNGIDELRLIQRFSDSQYLYVILGDSVYDLKRDEKSGQWGVSIEHQVKLADSGWLYGVTYQGYSFYAPLRFAQAQGETLLSAPIELSDGVTESKNAYTVQTNVNDNRFSSLRLFLNTTADRKKQMLLDEYRTTGWQKGYYYHTAPSGRYQLQVKANSNLADEDIYYEVELQQGQQYCFSVNLQSFEAQQVQFSELRFELLCQAPEP